jgi:hypothetical protein
MALWIIAAGEYQSMLFTLLSFSDSSSTSGHCFHLSVRLTEGTTMPHRTHALAHRDSFASALERDKCAIIQMHRYSLETPVLGHSKMFG